MPDPEPDAQPPGTGPAGAAGAPVPLPLPRGSRPPGLARQLRNLILLLGLAVVVSIVGVVVGSRIRPPASLLAVGSQAPAIRPQASGPPAPDQVALHSGHPLVVEFFETTCPVCQAAAPQLCDLLQGHPDAFLVAVDAATEDGAALASFKSEHYGGCAALSRIALVTDPCPAQTDSAGLPGCDNVTARWKVSVVPTVYVLDARGVILAAASGSGAVDDVRPALDRTATASP